MKIKTSELSGGNLDWAVAMSVEAWTFAHAHYPTMTLDPAFSGVELRDYPRGEFGSLLPTCVLIPRNSMRQDPQPFCPSTDWSQGGPLIEKYFLASERMCDGLWQCGGVFKCALDSHSMVGEGETPLIALCRAIVAAKLGDEVDVPEGSV